MSNVKNELYCFVIGQPKGDVKSKNCGKTILIAYDLSNNILNVVDVPFETNVQYLS